MPQQNSKPRFRPVIRVFVSSTFSDLKPERNALQEQVFPRLEQLCAQNGFQFQAIDLRWGVSSEAGLDHRTMRICLDELRRAQDISPEPNFLVLLGNRYGWRPLPEEISHAEFEQLAAKADSGGENQAPIPGAHGKTARQVLGDWYRRDENVVVPDPPETSPDRAPLNYLLQPRTQNLGDGRDYTRTKDNPLKDTQDWIDVQEVLWSIINAAFPAAALDHRFDLDWAQHVADVNDRQHPKRAIPQIARFQASATEQEIWCGALSAANAERHVIACFREIANRDDFTPADVNDFFDLTETGKLDEAAAARQKALKVALKQKLHDNAPVPMPFSRLKREQGKAVVDVSDASVQDFCGQVEKRLWSIIDRQIKEYWRDTEKVSTERTARELEIEQDEHERFGYERGGAKFFVGRKKELEAIHDYLLNNSPWPLVVHGASGCGKTALLARAAGEMQNEEGSRQKPEVIVRFIGVTPRSSDIRSLLGSLCQQLRLRHPRESELPTDIKVLSDELQEHFKSATPEKPLILFLDALDQLSDADNGRLLNWIPTGQSPPHVKLVVSCLSDRAKDNPAGQPFAELTRRQLIAKNSINLDALLEDEAGTLLFDRWLPQAERTLNRDQRERIGQLLKSEECRQAIYLKLLFEEARLWRSYDAAPSLGESVPAILGQLLKRLGQPANHGQLFVERVLGYLAASRHGLAENEILEVLFADPEYKAALDQATKQTRHELPSSARRIPIAIWSRLRFDLAPYLTERAAPGANVLTFYHRQVAEWVQEHFVKASEHSWQPHRRLADYFRNLADPEKNQSWKGDSSRPFLELPYHYAYAEMWSELVAVLEDSFFLEAKITKGFAFDVVENFADAVRKLPRTHPQLRILALLEEALRRDIHFIARHSKDYPQALFQCVWNSCWWYDCAEAGEHYKDGKAPGADTGGKLSALLKHWRKEKELMTSGFCWLRSHRPPPIQIGTPQIAVFRGHDCWVKNVAYSPDGRKIVSGMHNQEARVQELRVWDAASGKELAFYRGHKGCLTSVGYSPDGRHIVSASIDNTVRVWDAASVEELAVLRGHKSNVVNRIAENAVMTSSGVNYAGYSPDGSRIVSASWDRTLRIWDAVTGAKLAVLRGHSNSVTSTGYSPDGRRIVSGSRDMTVRIWDSARGEELAVLHGHKDCVNSVSYSPDGRCIVSTGGKFDKTARVWDASTGAKLVVLRGHTSGVNSAGYSPDGRRIVSGSDDMTVRVWDAANGEELAVFRGHEGCVNSVNYSPDGLRIVSGSEDGTVRIWDVAGDAKLAVLNGHEDKVNNVAFSPDWRRILSGSKDGTVRVWDAASGAELAVLRNCDDVYKVGYSPDGRRIISQSWAGIKRMWDADATSGTSFEVILPGEDYLAAIADGPVQFPLKALNSRQETVLALAATGQPVARFPTANITTFSAAGTWAGAVVDYVCIVSLEGTVPSAEWTEKDPKSMRGDRPSRSNKGRKGRGK